MSDQAIESIASTLASLGVCLACVRILVIVAKHDQAVRKSITKESAAQHSLDNLSKERKAAEEELDISIGRID